MASELLQLLIQRLMILNDHPRELLDLLVVALLLRHAGQFDLGVIGFDELLHKGLLHGRTLLTLLAAGAVESGVRRALLLTGLGEPLPGLIEPGLIDRLGLNLQRLLSR